MQPVADLHTTKSAILFVAINDLFSPPILDLYLYTTGDCRPCDAAAAEQRY
jgi:hypothetical protein